MPDDAEPPSYLSLAQVQDLLAGFLSTPDGRKHMLKVARDVRRKRKVTSKLEDELIRDLCIAFLEGKRRFRADLKPWSVIWRHMDWMAWELVRSEGRRRNVKVQVLQLASGDGDDDESPIPELRDEGPGPDAELLAREAEAQADWIFREAKLAFKDDALASKILEGKLAGLSGQDLYAFVGAPKNRIEDRWKKVVRFVRIQPEGKIPCRS